MDIAAAVPKLFGLSLLGLDYPLARVIHIRQAQGALPGFKYRNIFSCLRQMPGEQGGIRHLWRGLPPTLIIGVASAPLTWVINEQVHNIGLFHISQNASIAEKLSKNAACGAASGGIVMFVFHPLKMASLRLQLDLGGGTLGPRASFQNSKQILTQIAQQAGVFSAPFSSSGSIYRGFGGTCAYSFLHRGLYFGLYNTFGKYGGNSSSVTSGLLGKFFIGYGVTSLAEFLTYPIMTGVVRAQAAVSPVVSFGGNTTPVMYRGALHAMTCVAKNEGITALWRGYCITIGRSILGALFLVGFDMVRGA
eukprot:g6602.t1